MVRSLVVGFGLVTALAVAGIVTPKGQAMLGLSHPAAEQGTPVTVIQDKPASIPAPAQSIAPAGPVQGARAPQQAPAASPRPQARPVGPVSQRPPAGQPVPQQGGGPGGLAGVANILLNLPQVLNQGHGGPSHGSDSWSEPGPSDSSPVRLHKNHRGGERHDKDAGDSND
jgi:hypothetical protein